MGQVPPAARPEPFWGKSPVMVAAKRHSWGLLPPGLGCEASMRGCVRGCARGRGCTAIPAGTGSQAAPLCLGGGEESFNINCSRVRKRERLSLCPRRMVKPGPRGAAAPGAVGTGGAGVTGTSGAGVTGTGGAGLMGTSGAGVVGTDGAGVLGTGGAGDRWCQGDRD